MQTTTSYRVLSTSVLTTLCIELAACTSSAIVPVTPALQDQTVSVLLTQEGMADLGAPLGAGAAAIQGRVVTASDSSLTMSVAQVTRLSGVEETWNGEQVTVPLRDASSVQREQRSVARSIAAAGLIGGGALLIGRSLGGGEASGTRNTNGGAVR